MGRVNHLDFSRQPERLHAYLDGLTQAVWHTDRAVPIENYTKPSPCRLNARTSSRLPPGVVLAPDIYGNDTESASASYKRKAEGPTSFGLIWS
jgi:hypothetical protein